MPLFSELVLYNLSFEKMEMANRVIFVIKYVPLKRQNTCNSLVFITRTHKDHELNTYTQKLKNVSVFTFTIENEN